MDLSRADLYLIKSALRESLEALPDSELPTRMGASIDEVRALRQRINDELAKFPPITGA